jgi:hypothetical protein
VHRDRKLERRVLLEGQRREVGGRRLILAVQRPKLVVRPRSEGPFRGKETGRRGDVLRIEDRCLDPNRDRSNGDALDRKRRSEDGHLVEKEGGNRERDRKVNPRSSEVAADTDRDHRHRNERKSGAGDIRENGHRRCRDRGVPNRDI